MKTPMSKINVQMYYQRCKYNCLLVNNLLLFIIT
uniref:Uncharacterized protein n=1 Tax=Wuchereria bancrofti TaxID=6293 RepID=A0AAF5PZN8_WUCBA